MCPNRGGQAGFTIVTALFLLVVLAALGAFMVSISTTQHAASALDVQGARAYQAARAGIEWGAYQVLNPENSISEAMPADNRYACAGATIVPLGGSLSGFTVTVSCASNDYVDGAQRVRVYQITSTATAGAVASPDYVERQLTATIATCREPDWRRC